MQDNRPLSPDIQIYRPQITSVLSIAHRITGVAMCAGSFLLVVWLVAVSSGPGIYNELSHLLSSWPGQSLLFAWTFSLFFHLCNGIRHLCWDAGYGFELRTIYVSGWIVLIASILLTLTTWAVALFFVGGNA